MLSWLLCEVGLVAADSGESGNVLLETAFIYNFAKFTRWPSEIWLDPDAPMRLCIAGSDDLSVALGRLSGQQIGGRRVQVEPAPQAAGGHCQIVYFANSERSRLRAGLQLFHGEPVLTISRMTGFARRGGIIELFRSNERIRFRINRQAARAQQLELSARLLELAEIIDAGVAP